MRCFAVLRIMIGGLMSEAVNITQKVGQHQSATLQILQKITFFSARGYISAWWNSSDIWINPHMKPASFWGPQLKGGPASHWKKSWPWSPHSPLSAASWVKPMRRRCCQHSNRRWPDSWSCAEKFDNGHTQSQGPLLFTMLQASVLRATCQTHSPAKTNSFGGP